MATPNYDSSDCRERLPSADDLGRSQVADPELLQTLFRAVQDEDLQAACEAAQSLALLGDRSIVPRLFQEREEVRAQLKAGEQLMIDASEGRRDMALTMAIISLLPPKECDKLLQTGDEFEKYMVRRKRSVTSTEEFWGPIRG